VNVLGSGFENVPAAHLLFALPLRRPAGVVAA
jgi:hypothetical protein